MSNMKKNIGKSIPYVGIMKYLLILGIVLIHCNLYSLANQINPGVEIVNFIAEYVSRVSVPCFFFLSGMLFFNGIKEFTPSLYLKKLKSRVRTLLIPYILWCLICALLLFIKARYLHFPGLGIFLSDGRIDIPNFLLGFWSIKGTGYPFAFAFWFIRNLMVFCVLSPIVYLFARSKILTIIVMLVSILTTGVISFSVLAGLQWFVLGAFYVLHAREIIPELSTRNLIIASVIFWSMCVAEAYIPIGPLSDLVVVIKVIASLYLTLYLAKLITEHCTLTTAKRLIAPTFMIYATHQCYATIVRKAFGNFFGYESVIGPVIAYIISFLTLVAAGYLGYIIMQRLCPRLLNLLTGGRE